MAIIKGSNIVDDAFQGGAANDQIWGFGGEDTLAGGAGHDSIDGGLGADQLSGEAGNDTLIGGEGQDTLYGGEGRDLLLGGLGADVMWGGAGDDTYFVDNVADQVLELSGGGIDRVSTALDSLTLATGAEILSYVGDDSFSGVGNAGANTIYGGKASDMLSGMGGHDKLFGGEGVDTLLGGDGADTLDGGESNMGVDQLWGGAGDDLYIIGYDGEGDIIEFANGGIDRIETTSPYLDLTDYAEVENVTLKTPAWTTNSWGEPVTLFTQVEGNAKNNLMVGSASADHFKGAVGADSLYGADGSDTLDGGEGKDLLVGGAGADRYIVDATDVIVETASADVDIVETTATVYTLSANLEKLIYKGFDTFVGTGNAQDNWIYATYGDDTLHGLDGNDYLLGDRGNDTAFGGAGDDTFTTSLTTWQQTYVPGQGWVPGPPFGDDVWYGGEGDDIGSVNGRAGRVTFHGEAGDDLIATVEDQMTIHIEAYGGEGADSLQSGAGVDRLEGGAGADVLKAGDGADTLIGGADADDMTGGAGADRFIFGSIAETAPAAADIVRDFESGSDVLDFSAIDANARAGAVGDQAFKFIGEAAFTKAGQLRVSYDVENQKTFVEGEVNGDKIADFKVELEDLHELHTFDFIL